MKQNPIEEQNKELLHAVNLTAKNKYEIKCENERCYLHQQNEPYIRYSDIVSKETMNAILYSLYLIIQNEMKG